MTTLTVSVSGLLCSLTVEVSLCLSLPLFDLRTLWILVTGSQKSNRLVISQKGSFGQILLTLSTNKEIYESVVVFTYLFTS